MTPNSERTAKSRKAKRDAGLVPLPEIWVPAGKLEQVKAAIRNTLDRDTAEG